MKQKTGDFSNNIYTLEYNSVKYYIKVEYDEKENKFIEIFIEKEKFIDDTFYYIKRNSEEFKEKLFRFCDANLKRIHELIVNLIDEKLVSITEINDNYLILSLKMFISGSKNPITAYLKLTKEKYDQNTLTKKLHKQIEELTLKVDKLTLEDWVKDDRIKMLSEKLNKLEEKNGMLFEKVNKSEEEKRIIKLLQIYPKMESSNQLRKYLEIDGYGKGKIQVVSVSLNDFNKEPNQWLKLGDKWNYDVIFFGMWDGNAGIPLEEEAANAVEAFIKDNGSCILTHDRIGPYLGKTGFNKLREYFGIKVGKWNNSPYGDYNNQWAYFSSKVKISKTGSLTTYPWKIGEINTVLTIPETHTSSNAAYKDNVWLELCDGRYEFGKEPDELHKANYSDTFYLSIKGKCAVIQAGHSINATNSDEKKIIANLIFYLYNLKKIKI